MIIMKFDSDFHNNDVCNNARNRIEVKCNELQTFSIEHILNLFI